MTSTKRRGRGFTLNYGDIVAGKSVSASKLQLARALKGKVVESSALHSDGDDSTSSLAVTRCQMTLTDRSIFITTITTAGSDKIVAVHIFNVVLSITKWIIWERSAS